MAVTSHRRPPFPYNLYVTMEVKKFRLTAKHLPYIWNSSPHHIWEWFNYGLVLLYKTVK